MRHRRGVLLQMIVLGLASSGAAAQGWPTKPIKVIVPFAAGSAVDIVPRLVLDQVAVQLGQSIIVENRPGAGGTAGASAVASAEADGHTILAHSSAHTIAPALYSGLRYHPAKDFAAVVPLGVSPFILVVPPSKGFKTVGDLVTAARATPGAFNFASVGVGSASHVSAERFNASAGVKATHVPFKGGAEAMTEIMAGRIDYFFIAASAALTNVREGKLTALAVNGAARSTALPDVPTLAEAGFANAEYPLWYGLFLPAKTPREIVDRLHRETISALKQPKVRDNLSALAVDPMELSPREFDALIERNVAVDDKLILELGLKSK